MDAAVPQETYSPIPNIKKIKPDILMESGSHSEKEMEETRRVMESFGGRIVVMPYYPSQSSTNIKKKIKELGIVNKMNENIINQNSCGRQ